MGQVLGLDLGPNSIGWALVDEDNAKLIAAGARVFPEGVDAFDTSKEKSRTQERRTKRGMRRQIARRARRKRILREILTAQGLLPTDGNALDALLREDPYVLRARGLDQPLTAHEFGRVLLHLNTRRGFQSNSKSDKAKAKETSDTLKEISALAKEIEDAGHRTLGEHLAAMVAKPGEKPLVRIRGRHTRRDMLHKEFDMLWAAQKKHHPTLLTDELKTKLDDPSGDETWWMRGAIFGQRNLYWPASMIGRCELEPRERRCPKAERIAQRYRLLSEVNNLKYIDPDTGKIQALDQTQRTLLLDHLSKKREMGFDAIRRLLGMLETVKFNLEKGERSKLKGHVVDCLMAADSAFGSAWWKLPEGRKDEIVALLADPRTPDETILRTAVESWGVAEAKAKGLLGVQLPAGYLNLSRKALEKLVPHMERGLLLMTDDNTPCALVQAGYPRPDQRRRTVLDSLPMPPELPNPVVRQALHELRTVVNCIIREYGKPNRIHVELARSIKMGQEDRAKYNKARSEREAARDAAAEAIRTEAPGTKLSRDLIDKVLLWKEQGERCVYSGRSIGLRQLVGGEVDVDHIFPRWRSLDNSFGNKVVCFRDMNQNKGDQTPFEWLSGDPARLEAVKNNTRCLPWRKRARFTQEKLDTDDFVARQLVDTAYISRAAVDYLRCLVAEPHHVLGGKGTYTAELRHLWGLETILSELPDSPAWAAQADLRPGEKNRADHRHHTIDAIVVALTDQRRLQSLSRLHKTGESGAEIAPWDNFRDSVKAVVEKINVSHRVQRRVSGALHEEMIHGSTSKGRLNSSIDRPWAKGWVEEEGVFVRRKRLADLSPAAVEDIRDPQIRKIVSERLRQHGIEPGSKQKIPAEVWAKPLTMASGVPITKVRVLIRMAKGSYANLSGGCRVVSLASNHHVEVVELTEGTKRGCREGVVVSTLEAAERVRHGRPVINRDHGPGKRFIMSLSISEMVLVDIDDGSHTLHRVQKMDVHGSIILRPHSYAGRVSDTDKPPKILRRSASTLRGKKVTVDPLGRIRWAND